MMKKGKVLSVRVSELDIASAKELCTIAGLHAPNMSTCISKALSLLLENLREKGTLERQSSESVSAYLSALTGDRATVGRDFDLTLPARPIEQEPTLTHSSTMAKVHEFKYTTQGAFADAQLRELMQQEPREFYRDESPAFDLDAPPEIDTTLLEDIRLTEQLAEEELLAGLLVTEHRGDDHEVKLIDPTTMVKPTTEEKESGE